MSGATAEAAASISIPYFGSPHSVRRDVVERYARLYKIITHEVAAIKPDLPVRGTSSIPAIWLDSVRQRITDSVLPIDNESPADGRWLTQEIADSAALFFQNTSDVLPTEPFIYSSRKGDLVAEFQAPHGRLTTVISQSSLIAFATVKDVAIEKRHELGNANPGKLRHDLKIVTQMLCTGQLHGEVESAI